MSAAQVYDFENILPVAIATAFDPERKQSGIVSDDPQFQKTRPRVEFAFETGSEDTPRRLYVMPDGSTRNSTWNGILHSYTLTSADADGKKAGTAFRSRVRDFMAQIPAKVNNVTLTTHHIAYVQELGTNYGINTEKGFEVTHTQYAIKFSVQADAWALLTT